MRYILSLLMVVGLANCVSKDKNQAKVEDLRCEIMGPQTPRDISNKVGTNPISFPLAPSYKEMNLCNIHFHKNAEHKGPGFAKFVESEDKHGGHGSHGGHGGSGGYVCNDKHKLSKKQLVPANGACKGIQAGDTIEVHWVHTSCDTQPGPTLGSCLSKNCADPVLKVETQVFLLVNDEKASSFLDYAYKGSQGGFHQAKSLPSRKNAVEFLGSTTGPSYDDQKCSPMKVNWSVTPQCQTLDINSLHKWCEKNEFNEDHAHGVRKLVVNPQFLSPIK